MSQDKGLDVVLTVILLNEQGSVLWLKIMGDEWMLHCLQKTFHAAKVIQHDAVPLPLNWLSYY